MSGDYETISANIDPALFELIEERREERHGLRQPRSEIIERAIRKGLGEDLSESPESAKYTSRSEARKAGRRHFWIEHDKDDYRCPDCGRSLDEIWADSFEIHHRDQDPFNNELSNLVALCRVCHMLREGRRPGFEAIRELRDWKRPDEELDASPPPIGCSNPADPPADKSVSESEVESASRDIEWEEQVKTTIRAVKPWDDDAGMSQVDAADLVEYSRGWVGARVREWREGDYRDLIDSNGRADTSAGDTENIREDAAREENIRVAIEANKPWAEDRGKSYAEIAEIVDYTKSTIGRWVRDWKRGEYRDIVPHPDNADMTP